MNLRFVKRINHPGAIWKTAVALGFLVCAAAFTQTARADCGSYTNISPKAAAALAQRQFLKPAAYRFRVAPAIPRDDDNDREPSIVGMWKAQFVSEGSVGIPDGTVVDSPYAQWHSDGTEIMNSSKPPITGNFCLGVWKQTGRFTYKLNHFALNWDSTGTVFIGPVNIREQVTLDENGNSYWGTFTIDQYDPNGNPVAHVAGKINAQRITPD